MGKAKIRTHTRREKNSFSPDGQANNKMNSSVWVYGHHAVQAVLDNPERHIHRVLVTENTLNELRILKGIAVSTVESKEITSTLPKGAVHQGCAIQVERLPTPNLDIVTPHEDQPCPLIVVLDQVTDPGNVGAIIRSAAAFNVSALILPERHSAPESGVIAKSACGGIEHVPIIRAVSLVQTLEELKKMGYWLLGLDGDTDTPLSQAVESLQNMPTAIVMGAEGKGLRRLTRKSCDVFARIPISSSIESLNVANATTIALYAFSQHFPKKDE